MKAIKKPVEVNAWQIDTSGDVFVPEWVRTLVEDDKTVYVLNYYDEYDLGVHALGEMLAKNGDYLVRGSNGGVWVVQKGTFEDEYEVVEDE